MIKENPKKDIKAIEFSRNFGKEAAIYAGLKKASGKYTSIIDSDLQQDPIYVDRMVNFLENNEFYDSVACFQKERKESKFLSFSKKAFYKIINKVSEIKFEENASDFRTINVKMKDAILSLTEYYRFSKGFFSWVGFNTYFMPYEVKKRNAGETSWTFFKLFRYALDGIIGFSTSPLKIGTYVGGILSFFSFIYLIVVIIQKLFFGINIEGYATIVCLILLIGGFNMLLLGIVGEYLARTYIEVKNRPIYIINDVYESEINKK